MNVLRTYLARQLQHPSGFGGRGLLRLLNRENAEMNQLAIASMTLHPHQKILEIGFGGGDLIDRLFKIEPSLHVTGIDPSSESIRITQTRLKEAIASGQLALKQSTAEHLTEKKTFDAIVTVNTLYFWTDVSRVLENSYRALKPGGQMAIAYNSKSFLEQSHWTQAGFQAYEVTEVESHLKTAGFERIQTRSRKSKKNGLFFCTVGIISPPLL